MIFTKYRFIGLISYPYNFGMCDSKLVCVNPIAKGKTYRRIFRTSLGMIGIRPIRPRKRA